MSGGGSSTTTSSSTVPPQFLQAYQNTVNRAQNVANTPYQAYNGPLVAGFSGDQTAAQQEIRNLQGSYEGDLGAAAGSIANSTQNLWGNVQQFSPSTIKQYENPYQSDVINATEGQIQNTDAQQFNQLAGNAGSAGAFGGDRMGVAQGILGGQQAVANNSTLAGLNQANYSQAVGEFNQQQGAQLGANEANQWLDSQAGYAYGNLANEQNSLGLTDASALAQSGLTQQQQQQAGYNTAYEQWQAQQAFPYQQTGWLANITEGIGSNVGGSSTTTQTNNADGGRVPRSFGGIVPPAIRVRPHFDSGGGILSDIPDVAVSYIPGGSPSSGGGGGIGKGPPPAPQPQQQQPGLFSNPASDIGMATGATSLWNNLGLGSLFGGGTSSAGVDAGGFGAAGVPAGWGTAAAADPWAAASGISSGAGGGAALMPAGTWATQGAAAAADMADPFAAATGADLAGAGSAAASTGAAAAGAGAGSAGFLGTLGSAVEAGAADVGSGIAAGAGALGSAAAAGASAIGDGLAAAGTWLLSLLALKHGGAVEPDEAQHKAGGGIVVPFPSHLARGGIATGNAGEMPYQMAPPVQATGTNGPMSYFPGSGQSGAPSTAGAPFISNAGMPMQSNPFGVNGTPNLHLARGGAAGQGITPYMGGPPVSLSSTNESDVPQNLSYLPGMAASAPTAPAHAAQAPSSSSGGGFSGTLNSMASNGEFGLLPMMFKKGGIVVPFRKHFDGGGPAMPDDDTDLAPQPAPAGGITTAATPAPAPTQDAAASYTPTKPNAWMPVLAALATAGLGRHHEAGHNIAEGVLAGLSTYGQEDTRYQGEQEKAASIQNEAKQLADNAAWHKDQMKVENDRNTMEGQHYTAMEGLEGQKVKNEAVYQQGEIGIRQQEAGTQADAEKSLADYRTLLSNKTTPIGTTPEGHMVFNNPYGGGMTDESGQPYTGPVKAMPNVIQHTETTQRGQDLAHGDRQAAMDQRAQAESNALAAQYGEGGRKAADTIYLASRDALGKPSMTYEQAQQEAMKTMPGFFTKSKYGADPLTSQNMVGATASGSSGSAAPAQSAAPAVPPPSALKPGMVVAGHTYNGGNPADPQSWSQ